DLGQLLALVFTAYCLLPTVSEQEPDLEAEPGLGPVGVGGGPGDRAAEVEAVADRLAEARSDVEVRHAAAFLGELGLIARQEGGGIAAVLERPAVHLEGGDQRAIGRGVPEHLVQAGQPVEDAAGEELL